MLLSGEGEYHSKECLAWDDGIGPQFRVLLPLHLRCVPRF
jgi:hypothetical protein